MVRRALLRLSLLSAVLFSLAVYCLDYEQSQLPAPGLLPPYEAPFIPDAPHNVGGIHPILTMMRESKVKFERLLQEQSDTLNQAVEAYIIRRGRPPPKGFDAWFSAAKARNSVIIEELWDPIYDDLTPIRHVRPDVLKRATSSYRGKLKIRQGALVMPDASMRPIFAPLTQMVSPFAQHLPDMDIPVNPFSQPRIVVPMEDATSGTSDAEHLARWMRAAPYASAARRACPPSSAETQDITDGSVTNTRPPHQSKSSGISCGFVTDIVAAKDMCKQTQLYRHHDTLRSRSIATLTGSLFPLFGDAKLSVNSDIRIPAADWTALDTEDVTDSTTPWPERKNSLMWRGSIDGDSYDNPCYSQRIHFVRIANGTAPHSGERYTTSAYRHMLRAAKLHSLRVGQLDPDQFHTWLQKSADVALTEIPICEDASASGSCCESLERSFSARPELSLGQQSDRAKLIGLLDGSFNDETDFLRILRSSSVPVRATLYRSWYDSRIFPWVQYIPMDNSFLDLYGILEFFFGIDGENRRGSGGQLEGEKEGVLAGHDRLARDIAEAGANWAAKVLRREDMEIYVFRLLLEYGALLEASNGTGRELI